MNNFFDTAIGKTLKTTLWLAGSYIAAYAISFIGSHHFTGVYVVLPGLINILVYGFNEAKDPTVPNLTSSIPMTLVPAVPASTPEIDPEALTVSPSLPETPTEQSVEDPTTLDIGQTPTQ